MPRSLAEIEKGDKRPKFRKHTENLLRFRSLSHMPALAYNLARQGDLFPFQPLQPFQPTSAGAAGHFGAKRHFKPRCGDFTP